MQWAPLAGGFAHRSLARGLLVHVSCPCSGRGTRGGDGSVLPLLSIQLWINSGSALQNVTPGHGGQRSKPGSADDLPQCGAGVKEGLGINKDNGRVLTWQAGFFICFFISFSQTLVFFFLNI